MIREMEIPEMIDHEMPVLQSRLDAMSASLFRSVKVFADYTKSQIEQGHIVAVKKCFALADKMLCEGDMIVVMAVRNIYIYSISKALDQNTPFSKICRSMLSDGLKKEYIHQLYAKGT